MYFTQQNVLLKQPIRIDYLMKQKPRGALAGKQESIRHQKRWAAKWRVTVSGELRFMTSYLENSGFFIVTQLNYPNYIENQI